MVDSFTLLRGMAVTVTHLREDMMSPLPKPVHVRAEV